MSVDLKSFAVMGYLSEQSIPYLPLIISIKLIGFLIILAIARNNKKKFEANKINNEEA